MAYTWFVFTLNENILLFPFLQRRCKRLKTTAHQTIWKPQNYLEFRSCNVSPRTNTQCILRKRIEHWRANFSNSQKFARNIIAS